ncbi:MAG TPA: MFS transporter, partial [Allocoleopsis sp.]
VLEIASNLAVKIGISPDLGQEIFVGGSYVLAGIILIFIRAKENLNNPHEAPHILEDLKDGLSYLKGNGKVRNAIIQLIILFSIFAALSVLAVRLAAILPIIRAEQFGFLMASSGLGMALGATILGNFGEKFPQTKFSLFGSLGVAVCLFCLGIFTQSLWFSLSLTIIMGICGAFIAVPMQTTIQSETPDQMRGKVFGLQNNVINIALSLPLALAGVAETVFGLRNVFISLSIIAISGGLLTWYYKVSPEI